jgi:hypothetical protein
MVASNKDFAAFSRELRENYDIWRAEGAREACQDLCGRRLNHPGSSCTGTCWVLLPITWTLYGEPWLQACVVHRVFCGVWFLSTLFCFGLFCSVALPFFFWLGVGGG